MKITVFLILSYLAVCRAAEKNYGEPCQEQDTCKGDTICNQAKICKYGKCECKEGYARTSGNRCKKLMKIGETCSENSDCVSGARSVCEANKCMCNPQLSASENRTVCEKYVGDPCTGDVQCRWGDTMMCQDEKCACLISHKEYKRTCIPYELGESCSFGKACIAGSCRNDKCTCGSDQIAYLNRYCVHKEATQNLNLGDMCYPSATGAGGRYCGKGLICGRCPNDSIKDSMYVCMSKAPSIHTGLLLTLLYAFTSIYIN